jgi:syntaxin-binding protein 5
MIEQARTNEMQSRTVGQAGASSAGGQDQGYWAYMQRQITERTEKLGTLSDNVSKLEETSASWAEEASKYVQKTKRNLVMGAVKGKFGI